jgi:hypothetical protein
MLGTGGAEGNRDEARFERIAGSAFTSQSQHRQGDLSLVSYWCGSRPHLHVSYRVGGKDAMRLLRGTRECERDRARISFGIPRRDGQPEHFVLPKLSRARSRLVVIPPMPSL